MPEPATWVQHVRCTAITQIWSDIRQAITVAMSLVCASRDVWKPYWAAQQRFFKLLCVSLKARLHSRHSGSSMQCCALQPRCICFSRGHLDVCCLDALTSVCSRLRTISGLSSSK